jgi:hypothetical protein
MKLKKRPGPTRAVEPLMNEIGEYKALNYF